MESEKKSEVTLSPKKAGLSKAARDLLSRVRPNPSPERVFGLEPAAADAMARGVIDPLIDGAALPLSKLNQYRWYVTELCRLMRTKSGPDLAFCMELLLKKWLGFGLEPNTAAFLAGIARDTSHISERCQGATRLRREVPLPVPAGTAGRNLRHMRILLVHRMSFIVFHLSFPLFPLPPGGYISIPLCPSA